MIRSPGQGVRADHRRFPFGIRSLLLASSPT